MKIAYWSMYLASCAFIMAMVFEPIIAVAKNFW